VTDSSSSSSSSSFTKGHHAGVKAEPQHHQMVLQRGVAATWQALPAQRAQKSI
jgi:hypothetical protein